MKRKSLLFSLVLLTASLVLMSQSGLSQIPQTMSYQGVLANADGTAVADGVYSLTFRLYIAGIGTTAKWQETHSSVPVIDGLFNVFLGSVEALTIPFDVQYWLGISVDGGAELEPRVKLASSPYSLNAQSVVDNAITGSKIADGHVVRSINGKTDAVTLAEGANVTITPSSNTLTISSTFNGWSLTGNAGTTAGTHFLGTTDNQPLELRVNNLRIMRLEHGTYYFGEETANVIAGYSGNSVGGAVGATIAGGGGTDNTNRATGNFATVGGGRGNEANSSWATVGGGIWNTANGQYSNIGGGRDNVTSNAWWGTIGGGGNNQVTAWYGTIAGGGSQTEAYGNRVAGASGTIGGGKLNKVFDKYGTIGGGYGNETGDDNEQDDDSYATVPGGRANEAVGEYSFAAGFRAKANHDGCFVWADSTDADVTSSHADQFNIRANGGARVFCSGGYTALYVETNGTGRTGHFRITNPSSTSNSVSASTQGSGNALVGYTTGSGWAGYFEGDGASSKGVYITTDGSQGLEVVGGSKSAVVKTSQGARALYSEEATEVWFTDYGFGRLENGHVAIHIDPLYMETVNLEEPYHVFVQVNDPNCQGVAVTNRTSAGFEVVELRDGHSDAEFSYRIVAKRRGFEAERLEHREMADDDPNLVYEGD